MYLSLLLAILNTVAAIVSDFYRCTVCGEDTRQYVNGAIKYLKLDETDREWLKRNHSSE